MNLRELRVNIGKQVLVNGRGDLYCDVSLRPVINHVCTLVKQCKSGLIQVERDGKLYSVPLRNVDPVDNMLYSAMVYVQGADTTDLVGVYTSLMKAITACEKTFGAITKRKVSNLLDHEITTGDEQDLGYRMFHVGACVFKIKQVSVDD